MRKKVTKLFPGKKHLSLGYCSKVSKIVIGKSLEKYFQYIHNPNILATAANFSVCKIPTSTCFESLVQSYNCKQIHFSLLHAKKMAEVALLNVRETLETLY